MEHTPGKLQNGDVPKTPDTLNDVSDEVFTYMWLQRMKKADGVYRGDVCYAIALTLFEVHHVDPFEIALDAGIVEHEDVKKFYESKTVLAAIIAGILGVVSALGYSVPPELYPLLGAFGLYGLRDAMQ